MKIVSIFPMKPLIVHVDMDCFFAACEMKRNPQFRQKPLVIGASRDAPRGVVSTANYVARKYGVHSAMPISQAVRLCPNGIFLKTDIDFYRSESQKIMEVLHSFQVRCLQASIDEMYLDFSGHDGDWVELGRLIRKKVYDETGYTCSVGIATSMRVAKIASGYTKPHGVTVVYNQRNFLSPLPISNIQGIGKKSIPSYHTANVYTIGDLAQMHQFSVLEKFGSHALTYWHIARGEDESVFDDPQPEKSYSREVTFPYDLYSLDDVLFALKDMSVEAVSDLADTFCKTVTLKIRYSDFKTITRSKTFVVPTNSQDFIAQRVSELLQTIDTTKGIRLAGIRLGNFVDVQGQKQLDSYVV